MNTFFKLGLGALLGAMLAGPLGAQEAQIRKNLALRIPQLKAIDEVRPTPIAGVFEVRINGTEILYTDARGDHLFQGELFDTRNMRNLTEERVNKLTAVKFETLPFKDAFTVVRGNGQRKMAVFEDPNCSYCKRFERDMQKVDNVTIYMFLLPILGPDSVEKSKAIWCAKDKAQAWQDFMLRDQPLPTTLAMCDTTALSRNVELSRKFKISGTPTIIFADGTRVPGALDAKRVESYLASATAQ